ncbi:aminoglycoside phosphotransferase family protein [Nocardiopsis xinjiangensis]|uniref:phosphotransferase n=1 Tax=Nocardiopsis xinjiangensis TaxID=124285 RepID=UPI00037D423F|nr:phosphotransferase [Nocardiopsis xinjiangensis]
MTQHLTQAQRAQRTDRARDAAVATARELGLTVTDPLILHDLFSVVVHLAPAPVVARVPTVLPPATSPHDLATRQQHELDTTQWLHEQAVPVIAPSPLTPRRPLQRDGFSLTFWTHVPQDQDAEPDYAANAELTPALHRALRHYPGELPFLSAADPQSMTAELTRLQHHPDLLEAADLDRAQREWQLIEPLVRSRAAFEKTFPDIELQPVHGDSPPANIFPSTHGPLYSDFELICLGPIEWDLAGLPEELVQAYDHSARDQDMREADPDVLAFVNTVGKLRVIATLALIPQLPELSDHLTPAVQQWKQGPFAGGLHL